MIVELLKSRSVWRKAGKSRTNVRQKKTEHGTAIKLGCYAPAIIDFALVSLRLIRWSLYWFGVMAAQYHRADLSISINISAMRRRESATIGGEVLVVETTDTLTPKSCTSSKRRQKSPSPENRMA